MLCVCVLCVVCCVCVHVHAVCVCAVCVCCVCVHVCLCCVCVQCAWCVLCVCASQLMLLWQLVGLLWHDLYLKRNLHGECVYGVPDSDIAVLYTKRKTHS